MNATKLRLILAALIILSFAGIGAIIYYANSYLTNESKKTVQTQIDAELSTQDLEKLKNLERVLQENAESVKKAEQIVSDSKQYMYQDQIVNDINTFAARTGVQVDGFDFGSTTPAGGTAPLKSELPQVNGVKTQSVTVTLSSPLPFDNYLKFVKAIENNLTKMQISGINMTPDAENPNNIVNPTIVLLVYVR